MKYCPIISMAMLLCLSCNNHKVAKSESSNDSTIIVSDSLSTSDTEDIDWTPEGFKAEHHDEWYAVKQCIDIMERDEGDIDYSEIDKIVRAYVASQEIDLPTDKYQQIKKIEEICESRFDFSEYDESNMGMLIANSSTRLFYDYVNYLLKQEAQKMEGASINLQDEEKKLRSVMESFYICCDSIGHCFEGSGGWTGRSYVDSMEKAFIRSLCEAILNPQSPERQLFQLTPKHFKEECGKRCANYKQEYEEYPSPQTAKKLLDEFSQNTCSWLEYRAMVEMQIQPPVLKVAYSHITRSLARKLFIHLKNNFNDIGMMSPTILEVCLDEECSDEEMLRYSFEKAYKKYMEELNL